jgi:hypothetical protein
VTEPISVAQYFPWDGGSIFVGTAGAIPAHARISRRAVSAISSTSRQEWACVSTCGLGHLRRTSRRMIGMPPSLLDISEAAPVGAP